MTFKTIQAVDMANTILNVNEFGESITYVDKSSTEKTIKAIVERGRLDHGQEGGDFAGKEIEILIANHATNGMTSINTGETGQDTVKVPEFVGQAAIVWRVAEIVKNDDTTWTLRCVK